MKAGLDFGSTLIKAAWMNEGKLRFATTADTSLENIVRLLHSEGIKQINIAGIGYSDIYAEYLKDFNVKMPEGDLIAYEKRLQAKGVAELIKNYGLNKFILVSVGTGTSYTLKLYCFTIPLPMGNSLGGGFLEGFGKHLGIEDYCEMSRMASDGNPLNIYVKDKVPGLKDTAVGDYVVAHMAKASKDSSKEDILATAIDAISATTAKDLAMLSHFLKIFKWTKDVIYIGTAVSGFPALRKSLENYTEKCGKIAHFPDKGEYALAVGAYLQK